MNFPADRLRLALADRYRIEHELGAGGMATVYLAEDLKHDRKVAIKVLKPELAAVLGAERFVQEIKTTAALSHPHILPLFDSGEAGGFLYYVMPYIQGETIRDRLNRETQLGIDEAVKITTEVADALDYAHRNGVIHRDIKPENILLHDGRPMVMDFGIALAVSAAAGGRMTETGLSLGTPHYMSPEQATADKTITARSDVYSLASVLYEMLTGHPPHVGSSAQQIIMRIIADVPRPATELRKSVPAHVAAALTRALEKLPADRFDSARAFAEALGDRGFRLAESDTPAAGASASDGAATGAAGWRARAAVPLAALSIVLAAALAFMSFRSPSSEGFDRPTFTSLDVSGMGVLGFGSDRFAVAPDGRSVAFVVEDGLAIRSLDSTGVVPLGRTFNATLPFWSPDSRAIGFFARDSLRVIELASGAMRALCAVPRGSEGGTWSPSGTILFASGDSLVTTDARGERCTGERGGALDAGNALRPYFLSDGRLARCAGERLACPAPGGLPAQGRGRRARLPPLEHQRSPRRAAHRHRAGSTRRGAHPHSSTDAEPGVGNRGGSLGDRRDARIQCRPLEYGLRRGDLPACRPRHRTGPGGARGQMVVAGSPVVARRAPDRHGRMASAGDGCGDPAVGARWRQ